MKTSKCPKQKTETPLCASVTTFTLKPVMKAQRDSRGVAALTRL